MEMCCHPMSLKFWNHLKEFEETDQGSKKMSRPKKNSLCLSWNTLSWKGQLEKTRSWKVRHEIGENDVGNFGLKLKSSG